VSSWTAVNTNHLLKVVPEFSSLLGNYREHAETLQANHMSMCRFSGTDDPNYRIVAGEIHYIYSSILGVHGQQDVREQAGKGFKSALHNDTDAMGEHFRFQCPRP
jgi:hypothetical protein